MTSATYTHIYTHITHIYTHRMTAIDITIDGMTLHGADDTTLADSSIVAYSETFAPKRGRPRKVIIDDGCGRPFTCGCGKVYKSWISLYSHTKFVHKGVQPSGSVRLREVPRSIRVRVHNLRMMLI